MHRIAIVGGGAAGMTAALQLRARGLDFTLLESAASLGGMIHTVADHGWVVEAGPNALAEPEPAVRALLDGAGLTPSVLRPDPRHTRRFLVHSGKLVAVPRSVGELVAWPVLSAGGRMRLLKEPFVKAAPADAEESVEAFVRRRLGDEMLERVFDPLLAGATAGDPAQVLMRYAFPRLVEWEHAGGSLLRGAMRAGMDARRKAGRGRGVPGGIWSCRGGLAEIPRRIEAFLGDAVRTRTRVVEVHRVDAGYRVVDATGHAEEYAAVLCAIPATGYRGLRIEVPGAEVLQAIAQAPSASMASVSLGFRREEVSHPLDGHGLLAPFCERRSILGTLFVSSLFPDRAPAGHVLLTSMVGGTRRADLAARPADELVALVRSELEELLGARGEPQFSLVTHWPDSQPQAVAGHTERLAAVQDLERGTQGLAFAGAWHDGTALADAMRSGRIAANHLAGQLA